MATVMRVAEGRWWRVAERVPDRPREGRVGDGHESCRREMVEGRGEGVREAHGGECGEAYGETVVERVMERVIERIMERVDERISEGKVEKTYEGMEGMVEEEEVIE